MGKTNQKRNLVNGERRRKEEMDKKKKPFVYSNLNLGITPSTNKKWEGLTNQRLIVPKEILEKPEDKYLIDLGNTVSIDILKKTSLYEDVKKALDRKNRREKFLSKHA